MEFEMEQIKLENIVLKDNASQEKKISGIFRQLYNNLSVGTKTF